VEKKKKIILLFFVFLIAVSFLVKLLPSTSFPQVAVLNLSKLPLKLINLSFIPIESVISCHNSLRDATLFKKENQELKVRLMQLEEMESENKGLRESLSFKQRSGFSLVAARVIYSDASNLRRSLVIDKGKNQGIRLGNPVIVPEGMVGMVVEVGNSASRIMLINDPDFSMAAKVRRSNAIGVVTGSLEGSCRLKYLEIDEDIQIDDEVVSAGTNSRFPGGISVGRVVQISREQSGLTFFAVVKPKVKLSSLEEVLVIVNY
jgi:rod shape-determining protein MreC